MNATKRQKITMLRLEIDFDDQTTKSEAANLISQEIEAREQLDDFEYNAALDNDLPLFDFSIGDKY